MLFESRVVAKGNLFFVCFSVSFASTCEEHNFNMYTYSLKMKVVSEFDSTDGMLLISVGL